MSSQENDTLVVRSNNAQPIQDVFAQINDRINDEMVAHPEYADDVPAQKSTYSYIRIILRTRVTEPWKNSIESVQPFYVKIIDA
jgi:amidophosphoribosyltransferase